MLPDDTLLILSGIGETFMTAATSSTFGLRTILQSCCVAGWFCCSVVSIEQVAAQTRDYDRGALIVLAPNGPVVTELQISVARRPYTEWVAGYLAKQLDLNQSGGLTLQELQLVTERFRGMIGVNSPRRMLQLAADSKAATSVPVTVFARWLQSRIPRAFDISAESGLADDAVRLGSLIDTDGNMLVSGEELQAALQTMRFRDLDDDQTFSVSELLPYRDPRTQNASLTPDVASLPFVHLADGQSIERAADRILTQYGSDDTCQLALFRFSPGQLAGLKLTSDSELSREQLRHLLQDPPSHIQLDIQLSDLANRSQTDATIAPGAKSFCSVESDGFSDVKLNIDGIPLTVKSRGGGMNDRSYLRGFLGQNFVMYDTDKSQTLDESEFGAFGQALSQTGVNAEFTELDVDGDAMVSRNEMYSFAERDLFTRRSKIEVSIYQDGKTLFGIIDVNGDRRLTVRELQNGQQPLSQYDLNGDAQFGESELGTEYVLTIGLGRSDIRRSSNSAMAAMQMQSGGTTDAILPGVSGLSGPEWFRRMDRNQDGTSRAANSSAPSKSLGNSIKTATG
jgi:Ca2+-binding EF-hand superfamily protein